MRRMTDWGALLRDIRIRARPMLLYLGQVAVLAVAYFLSANLGLTVSFLNGVVAAVWPPAALAMAALALWGRRLWPAVTVGAFAANYWNVGLPPAVAATISVADTFETLLAVWLLRRFGRVGEPATPKDAVVLMAVVVTAPLPISIGGVITLWLSGLTDRSQIPQGLLVWWVGAALNVLVLLPVLLSWLGPPATAVPTRRGELAACLTAVAAGSGAVFGGDEIWALLDLGPIAFTPFLLAPLVWASLRLGPRGESLAMAVMFTVAVAATLHGIGPFALFTPLGNLVRVQLTFASAGTAFLILAAAITELKEARHKAEAASSAKSRFVAAVRHDVSQPLQAAQLFLSLLASSRLDGPGQAAVRKLAGSLDAMDGTLNALRDITAVECEVVRPEVSTFGLEKLLDQLAEEYRVQAMRKGLDFHFVPCLGTVRTDRQLLGRVLRNLLANAIRYTPEGRILLGCRRTSGGIRIEIWDTGPGIPPSERDAIFQPFHRAVPALQAEPNGGLGLGLATVQRLAAQLGLSVALRSTLGKGSVFSVVVPTG